MPRHKDVDEVIMSIMPAGRLRELAGEAWREVLRCEGPADDDNFFELGGRSLTGAQVLSRLQPHVRAKLSIRVLFDHPVFHEFAAAITRLGETRRNQPPQ
jgi:hypothetical protein